MISFVRDACTVKPGKQTRCQDLYDAYKRWTEEEGRSKMGRTRFYEEFSRAFPDCARVRVRVEVGENPVFVFNNIDLQNEYKAGYL